MFTTHSLFFRGVKSVICVLLPFSVFAPAGEITQNRNETVLTKFDSAFISTAKSWLDMKPPASQCECGDDVAPLSAFS